MAKKPNPTKNLTAEEKDAWERQHTVQYITTLYQGGEHLRAAALAAEANLNQSDLDTLSEKNPGILDHMPADKGDVRPEGTVPGNPTEDALRKDQPSGHPSNDGIDKPTLHAAPEANGFNQPQDIGDQQNANLPSDKQAAKK